jgi:hypothetical protein
MDQIRKFTHEQLDPEQEKSVMTCFFMRMLVFTFDWGEILILHCLLVVALWLLQSPVIRSINHQSNPILPNANLS